MAEIIEAIEPLNVEEPADKRLERTIKETTERIIGEVATEVARAISKKMSPLTQEETYKQGDPDEKNEIISSFIEIITKRHPALSSHIISALTQANQDGVSAQESLIPGIIKSALKGLKAIRSFLWFSEGDLSAIQTQKSDNNIKAAIVKLSQLEITGASLTKDQDSSELSPETREEIKTLGTPLLTDNNKFIYQIGVCLIMAATKNSPQILRELLLIIEQAKALDLPQNQQ